MRIPLALIGITIVAVVAFGACATGDKDRADGQNGASAERDGTVVAGATAEATPERDPGGTVQVSVFDLRAGDCIAERGNDAALQGDVDEVRVAPCNHPDVTGAVTILFAVEDPVDAQSAFPGEPYLEGLAAERCDRGAPFTYLIPLEESWSNGDRTIVCIDDYTAVYVLGGCVDDSDLAIACENEDAARVVTALVDMSDEFGASDPYPGVGYFDGVFAEECRSDDDYFLYPTERSWAAGDRELVCTRPYEP